jgi:hypothetical protein
MQQHELTNLQKQAWILNEITSILDGEVVGAYRSTTFPFLSTKNLAKFHLILSPNSPPPFCDFKYLYKGAWFCPFTSIYQIPPTEGHIFYSYFTHQTAQTRPSNKSIKNLYLKTWRGYAYTILISQDLDASFTELWLFDLNNSLVILKQAFNIKPCIF